MFCHNSIKFFQLIVFLFLWNATAVFGQTGPGGVQQTNGASELVMWLDASNLALSNGAEVTSWLDVSGYGNNALSVSGNRPQYNSSWTNGMPAVQFVSTNDDYLSVANSASTQFDHHTIYVVADYSNSSDNWTAFVMKESNYSWKDGWGIARNNFNQELISFVDDYEVYDIITSQNYNTPFMATQFKNANNLRLFMGGVNVQSVANTGFSNSSLPMRIGAAQAASAGSVRQFLDGNIAEIIIFNDNLKSSERILVNNYLSSKYGITTSADKYAYDANHPHEVFGICRKNNSNNFVATSQGQGIVEISNPSQMDDEEFLLIGHDNADLTAYYNDAPNEYTYRLERSWRVDEQGELGTLNVSFDVTGLGLSTDAGEYALLIDDDGDFSNASIHTTGASYSGGEISFTGVNFSNGDYFSLAAYNSVIWNGASYQNGSGGSNAPNTADSDRKFFVNGSGASLSSDANARNMVVAIGASLTITGNSDLSISNEVVNNGTVTVNNGSGLVQTHLGTNSNSGSGTYVILRNGNSSINSFNSFCAPIVSPTITSVFSGSNPCDIFAFDASQQLWKYDYANGFSASCLGNMVSFNSTDVISGGDNQMDVGRGLFCSRKWYFNSYF